MTADTESTTPAAEARRRIARERRKRVLREGGQRIDLILGETEARALRRIMERTGATATGAIAALLLQHGTDQG